MTPTATARKIFESINALDVHTLSADERKQLGTAALELQQKVELPWDTLHRLVWVEVSFRSSFGPPNDTYSVPNM